MSNESNPRLRLDPREYGVQQDDHVQFTGSGFTWRVDRIDHSRNTLYVTSLLGKRRAIEQVSQVQSVDRDPTYLPPDPVDYSQADCEE